MTTLISNYSYMDLLKEYNYVPATIENSAGFIATVRGLIEGFSISIQAATTNYDFMSLVKDKTNYASVTLFASNDNEAILRRA